LGGVKLSEDKNEQNDAYSRQAEDVQILAENLVNLADRLVPVVLGISAAINNFYEKNEKHFVKAGKVLLELSKTYYVYNEFRKNCKMHDIVPHQYLYPLLQNDPIFFAKSHAEQTGFLEENWNTLSQRLLTDYPFVDDTGLRYEIFEEILKTHEAGLHKVCLRAAVIEIEGLASEYCQRFETSDGVKQRRKIINNWKEKIISSDEAYIRWSFVMLALENYIGNVFLSTGALKYNPNLSESDVLFSRNFHAHGFVAEVSPRQSMNAILFLHNIALYFSILSEVSKETE